MLGFYTVPDKIMLGFYTVSNSPMPILIPPPNQSISKPSTFLTLRNLNFPYLPFKSQTRRNPRNVSIYAEENGNGVRAEPKEKENGFKSNGNDEDPKKGNGRIRFNLRWADLLLDPDPDNIVAVGLTGLLTWASVQVLWQLLLISLAILIAALKYSFIAALLLFILITLL